MQDGTRYAWPAYAAICIMAIVWTGIQFNCMNLYAAPVVEEMGISRTAFMTVLSIPAVISAIISLVLFGTIEERVGMRRMLIIGGTLNTLAFASWCLMDSVVLLYLGGVLYGFGCSITAYNSVAAGVNRWFKQRTGTLMGIANALGNVAGIVFALVIATLIATVGWRWSFGICIALSAAATVACALLYKGSPDDLGVAAMYADQHDSVRDGDASACDDGAAVGAAGADETSATNVADAGTAAVGAVEGLPFAEELKQPRFWVIALGYLLLGTTTYGIMSTVPLFAVDLGFDDLQGQTVSASLFAAAIAMVPLGGICDRFGARWALFLSAAFTIASALLLRIPGLPFAGMLVAAALSGAAYSACGVTVGTGAKEAFGERDFGKKLGLCSGFMYIGLALGPALINLAFDTMGTYAFALIAFAAGAVAMIVLFFISLRRKADRKA